MKILPWVWFIGLALLWVIFYALHIEKLLDADMSSEMLLSSILSRENRIITNSWYYSTELRVLNNQLVFSLFFHFFSNWKLVRILSGIVLTALLIGSYYYLCVQMGIREYFPHTAGLFFLPFSTDYSYVVLYGLFYIPHIAISFTTLAMIVQYEKKYEKKQIKLLLGGGLFLLGLLAGLGGPRQVMILYLPLLLIILLRLYLTEKDSLPGAIISVFGGIAGYIINSAYLSNHYKFNSWGGINFTDFSFSRLETTLMGLLAEYGYREGKAFSLDILLRNVAAFLLLGGLIVYLYGAIRPNEKRTREQRLFNEYLLIALGFFYLLYNFTDMSYVTRYLLPYTVFLIPITGFLWKYGEKTYEKTLTTILVLAFCLGGAVRYREIATDDNTADLRPAVDVLLSEGYSSGYASFWNGNIVTEIANGALEMYTWDEFASEKLDVEELTRWLQPVSHSTTPPSGKIFLLLTQQENGECPLVRYLDANDIVVCNDSYVVYGFESYEDMLYTLSYYEYRPQDSAWISDGHPTEDGSWIVNPDGEISGPYVTLYHGTYHFTVTGSGLDDAVVNAFFGVNGLREFSLELTCLEQTKNCMIFEITVPENVRLVEFPITNLSDQVITVTSAVVERVR